MDGKTMEKEWVKQRGTTGVNESQTASCSYSRSRSSSCAGVRVYRAKQTNSRNKREKHSFQVCRSVWIWTEVCVREYACTIVVSTAACGCSCCVCGALKLKVDLCFSTTRWQNAATLQTGPMLGWPSYCNSSSCSTQFSWHRIKPACCFLAEGVFCFFLMVS